MKSTRTYPTLRKWREARGLTQGDAAAYLGLNQGHYSRIERGLRVPRRELLRKLAALTNVPLETLVGLE